MSSITIEVDEISEAKIKSLERQLKSKTTECLNKSKEIDQLRQKLSHLQNKFEQIQECKILSEQLVDKLEQCGLSTLLNEASHDGGHY